MGIFDKLFGKDTAKTVSKKVEGTKTTTKVSAPSTDLRMFIDQNEAGVILEVASEAMQTLGAKLNEISEEAYMNGYNWEVLINYYLTQKYPQLLHGLTTDPEAEKYIASYAGVKADEKAAELLDVLQQFITDEAGLCAFVKNYQNEIEWD